MSVEGFFVSGLLVGWSWGHWFSDRRAAKVASPDPAMALLCGMLSDIRQKRRFVGPALTITRFETLEIEGRNYTLTLASKGDPAALDREAA